MSSTPYTSYKAIHDAWVLDASYGDIYHMIVDWIETWAPADVEPSVAWIVHDIMRRAVEGDETHDIVEDFIYGECYRALRETFGDPK